MIRRLIALAFAALCLGASPALAGELGEKLDDATLADMRGGFVVGGLTIDFAAEMKTFVDGQLALSTRLTLDHASGSSTLTDTDLSGIAGGVSFGPDAGAFTVTSDGATAILQQMGDGRLANVLINSADNRTFRQELNLTLTLPGFESTQRGLEAARLGGELARQTGLFSLH